MKFEDYSQEIRKAILEYAFQEYGVTNLGQLKQSISEDAFEAIVAGYLTEASYRIMNERVDEAKFRPIEDSMIVEKLQAKIRVADEPEPEPEEPPEE